MITMITDNMIQDAINTMLTFCAQQLTCAECRFFDTAYLCPVSRLVEQQSRAMIDKQTKQAKMEDNR